MKSSLRFHSRTFASQQQTTPVVVMGLGRVGRVIARGVLRSRKLALVAAVDKDEALAGTPLHRLIDGVSTDMSVTANVAAALERARGGVLLLATGSTLDAVASQVRAAMDAGVSVVSTCPELFFPWLRYPREARALHHAAMTAGVSVLGTGVNPGFALDRLIAAASGACGNISHVHATRVVDVSNRPESLLCSVGVGLSPSEFRERVSAGELPGYSGLIESAALVALGLDIDCDELIEEFEPVVAAEKWDGPPTIHPGDCSGYSWRTCALRGGRVVIDLELTYAVGARDPRDSIVVDAEPKIDFLVKGGISGGVPTAWSAVNAAANIVGAKPGLLTVFDLPVGIWGPS